MQIEQLFCENGNKTEHYLNGTAFFDICFHDTVPVLLPLVYVFVICVPYLIYIVRNKKPIAHFFRRHRGHGPIQPMKIILSLCYLGIHVAESIFVMKLIFAEQSNIGHAVMRLCIGLIVGAFILATNLMEMKRDISTSTCLFILWTLLLVINSLRLSSGIIQSWSSSHPGDVAFGCTCVVMAIVLLQSALYGFIGVKTGNPPETISEPTSPNSPSSMHFPLDTPLTPFEEEVKMFDENPPSPEANASVMSMLSYWWMTTFVIKAWRRPVQQQQIYQLPFSEQAQNLSRLFNEAWKATLNKTQPLLVPVSYHQPLMKGEQPEPAVEKLLQQQQRDNNATANTSNVAGDGAGHRQSEQRAGVRLVVFALMRAFGPIFLYSGLIKLAQDATLLIGPVLMMALIQFLDDQQNRPVWQGYALAFALLIAGVLQAAFLHRYYYFIAVTSLRVRGSLATAIFEKTLRLSSAARQKMSTGETVNLVGSDTQNFLQATVFLHIIWSVPLQISVIIYLIWLNMGIATLAGLGFTVFTLLLSGVAARLSKRFQLEKLKKKDERVKLVNEALSNMRTIKVYAWEKAMQAKIEKARDEELALLRKATILNMIMQSVWLAAPVFFATATFATFIFMDPEANLDPARAFVSLVLFSLLRFTLIMLPGAISSLIQYIVSLRRIANFLLLDELDPLAVDHEFDAAIIGQQLQSTSSFAVRMKAANFSWQPDSGPILSDINVNIKRGQLVAVIGEIGSGKSSILSAILGDMVKLGGTVSVRGKMAYLPQTPWILNATLKENVLFSSPLDTHFYREVIDACALRPDLEMLPGGDQTEIGEKGANLSGGQKQRVALARAIYSKAEVYLLDDTLSAVDSSTGKHLFERVIGPGGILVADKNRTSPATRIWVTHKLSYLSKCDHIVFLVGGRILAQGTYQHLSGACPQFSDLVQEQKQVSSSSNKQQQQQQQQKSLQTEIGIEVGSNAADIALKPSTKSSSSSSTGGKTIKTNTNQTELQRITEAEKIQEGAVKLSVYGTYLKAMGVVLVIFYAVFTEGYHSLGMAAYVWLSSWTAQVAINATAALPEKSYNFAVYSSITAGGAICMMVSTVLIAVATLRAARTLHSNLIGSMMRSSMKFFEATPSSRILNRFTKDIDVVDGGLIDFITKCIAAALHVIATYIMVSIKLPLFLIVGIPLLGFAVFLQRVFSATIRQLKRIELASQSPLLSHFSETINGASSIRAFGRQKQFVTAFTKFLDKNHIAYYASHMTSGWLVVRTEFVGISIIFVASIIGVVQREDLDPSAVGLCLAHALSVGFTLFWTMQHFSLLEAGIVSVERLEEYVDSPKEHPWSVPEVDQSPNMIGWPSEGSVVFENVEFRYREGLEPALRNLSFSIRPQEKIGIVGRTGAGKTSLSVALLRLADLSGGRILIDGVDISKIGLHVLRNAITPIPQDPVLFTGSLRFNLDPFGRHPDDMLKRCLGLVHLRHVVEQDPAGLDMLVMEGGENFSAGQRQLICLARALLRRPLPNAEPKRTHILLMDEATAAVDTNTDRLITEMIRHEFSDSTVITIAHRLDTVLAYDRILVLANGQVVEFDTPSYLLSNTSSHLYSLAKTAGMVK